MILPEPSLGVVSFWLHLRSKVLELKDGVWHFRGVLRLEVLELKKDGIWLDWRGI